MLNRSSKFPFSVIAMACVAVLSQATAADHPWRAVDGWAKLPDGREWGSTSAVYTGQDNTIWVAERCGQNSCVGKDDVNPILQFDADGNLLQSFIFAPHFSAACIAEIVSLYESVSARFVIPMHRRSRQSYLFLHRLLPY